MTAQDFLKDTTGGGADTVSINSPSVDGMLLPQSHNHSQLVPIKIQQTHSSIVPVSSSTSCFPESQTTTLTEAQAMSGDGPQPLLLATDPSVQNIGTNCLTCLPELPEDYEEEEPN